MSHEAAAPRVRLNDDVWAHAISFLGDAKSLRAWETTSRAHLTISKKSTAWHAALVTASTGALASAFLKAAPAAARSLWRAWARRWRSTDCSAIVGGDPTLDGDPRLCVRDGGGDVLRRPHVVFAIGDAHAGVMNWDSRLSDGTVDDDKSLVLNVGERGKVYSETELFDGAIGTSCFVVEPDGTKMIELWRDVTSFCDFNFNSGSHMTYSHGVIQLSRFGSRHDARSVLNYMSSEMETPEGAQLMTLMGYVRFREVHFPNVVLGPRVDLQAVISDDLFQIVDAEASIGVCENDTQFEFNDLAFMLATALLNHPDADGSNERVRGVSGWRDALFAL